MAYPKLYIGRRQDDLSHLHALSACVKCMKIEKSQELLQDALAHKRRFSAQNKIFKRCDMSHTKEFSCMWCNHTCAISNRFSHWNCCDASLSTGRCAASIAQHAWCADHHTCNSSDTAPTIFLLFSFRAKRRRRSATGKQAIGGTATRRGTVTQYSMGLRRYYYTLHGCDVLQVLVWRYGSMHTWIQLHRRTTARGRFQHWFCNGFTTGFTEYPKFLKKFEGFCRNGTISQGIHRILLGDYRAQEGCRTETVRMRWPR